MGIENECGECLNARVLLHFYFLWFLKFTKYILFSTDKHNIISISRKKITNEIIFC